jgi:multidrug resistance efflux pump
VGDHVTRGQVLAVADATTVQAQLTAAQAARDLAQARLATDLAKPTVADRAAADIPVQRAQLALAAARRSLADTRAQGRASVQAARLDVTLAQQVLGQDRRTHRAATVIAADARAILTARAALRLAIAAARAADRNAADAVRTAALALRAAVQGRRTATAPSPKVVIAADRVALAQAEIAVATAQTAVSSASMVAPVDGVVTAVALAAGMAAPPGDGIQVQEGPMEATFDVPQDDLPSVPVGQQTVVTVAATGQTLTGHVASIAAAPSSAPSAPVLTYAVTVTLDDCPDAVRSGMTALLLPMVQ